MKTQKMILLVEDNEKILRGNKRMLMWEGFAVETATTLAQAYERISASRPSAIVLDIMLPDGSGMDFLKKLRSGKHKDVPVLLLTGLGGQDNIVSGFEQGADDYLTKPYDFPILLARLQALLRRAGRVPEQIANGRLRLDLSAQIAFLDDVDLLLTQKEFAVLLLLVQNLGSFVVGDYIYEKVWGAPLSANNNAFKSTIKRLRSKLENSGFLIEWSRDEGYSLIELP